LTNKTVKRSKIEVEEVAKKGLKMRKLALTDEQKAELVEYRDHAKSPAVRERCAALLKIADGMNGYQVALRGLLKRRKAATIYGWLNHYLSEGIAGLVGHQQGGARRKRQGYRA
jgi:hypothetical protein